MPGKEMVLWGDKQFSLEAAYHPAIPRKEGFHIVLLQKKGVSSPWADPKLYSRMSLIAAKACKVMMKLKMADWMNLHYDGNIGAAEGKPNLHIHIFGRYKSGEKWGEPLILPPGKGPYGNEPLSQPEIKRLRSALRRSFTVKKGGA